MRKQVIEALHCQQSHTQGLELVFVSCVSVPHLTVSSSHTVGCSPCCSLAPVYHQLSLEHGHHKQSSPPHHTSPAVCSYYL
ncbi:hypothetical protein GBAR_LOCUS5904 [Geodia barretti]|uniref:Uncharacterized protein n=1 Tax=Geodia barretti TaxID=519541 RepID=A0AA35WCV9_GEOBA|nr:hypothetical protein GBAR_LOCUS5904 [Geodia barretti]